MYAKPRYTTVLPIKSNDLLIEGAFRRNREALRALRGREIEKFASAVNNNRECVTCIVVDSVGQISADVIGEWLELSESGLEAAL